MEEISAKRVPKVKLTLTRRTVETLRPEDRPWIAWDDRLTGFGCRVQSTGTRTFIVNYRAGDGALVLKIERPGTVVQVRLRDGGAFPDEGGLSLLREVVRIEGLWEGPCTPSPHAGQGMGLAGLDQQCEGCGEFARAERIVGGDGSGIGHGRASRWRENGDTDSTKYSTPSFVLDVFGGKRMSVIYGLVLTAWAAAGIFGPLYVGYLKDQHPDRAVTYCFLIGVLILGLGYVFSYLLSDDRIRLGRPTLEGTLRRYGVRPPK